MIGPHTETYPVMYPMCQFTELSSIEIILYILALVFTHRRWNLLGVDSSHHVKRERGIRRLDLQDFLNEEM